MSVTVELVNFTPKPLETAFWAWQNMHNPIPHDEIPDFKDQQQEYNFLEVLYRVPHKTVLEYINTVWYINASRAFQQQLTRTREAAYAIQSLRVVNVGLFADNLNYHIPPGLTSKQIRSYKAEMFNIQEAYKHMISIGAPVEAARGLLPLNINSPITMTINMRKLVHMLELRMCKNTQGEFREVARQMKMEISKKISPYFAGLFLQPPCKHLGFCNSPAPCDLVPGVFKRAIDKRSAQDTGLNI